jgi:hypothetical protein
MIQKLISYKNFNDIQVDRIFYFNWTIDEIAEWELSTPGGVQNWMDGIIKAKSNETVMAIFRKVVGSSIGERTEDGEGFVKKNKLRKQFIGSRAYDAMLIEFMEHSDRFANFFNELLPEGLEEIAARAEKNRKQAEGKGDQAVDQTHSDAELLAMTDDAFYMLAGAKKPHKMKTKQFKDVAMARLTRSRANSGSVEKAAA